MMDTKQEYHVILDAKELKEMLSEQGLTIDDLAKKAQNMMMTNEILEVLGQ